MTTFLAESPMKTARRMAEADLGNRATAAEVQWLHANPLLWLRALVRIARDVENTIAKSHLALAALKPPAGVHPEPEYLEAKRAIDDRTLGRLHFKNIVDRRIEEVKAILGPGPIDRLMLGDLVEVFVSISTLADAGDLESAADKALFWAKRLAGKPTKRQPAPTQP